MSTQRCPSFPPFLTFPFILVHVHTYKGRQEIDLRYFLQDLFTLFFETGPPIGLELVNWSWTGKLTILASGHPSTGFCLPQPPQYWDCKNMPQHLDFCFNFTCVLGIRLKSSCFYNKCFSEEDVFPYSRMTLSFHFWGLRAEQLVDVLGA